MSLMDTLQPYLFTSEGGVPQMIPLEHGIYDRNRLLVMTVVWGERRTGLHLIWVYADEPAGGGARAWRKLVDSPTQSTTNMGFPSVDQVEKPK
jgi:hypothetical protein